MPPGDKSITHRALLMGALAAGETTVENANRGADCEATLACLEALGIAARRQGETLHLRGAGGAFREPDRVLDCGNSGTTLRLLAGPLSAQPFLAVLAGDTSLHRRPVERMIEPLRRMGARLWGRDHDRFPPLVVQGGPLRPIEVALPVASAQVASCVLLAGLFADGLTVVEVPGPARDHTERMLGAFGIEPLVEARPAGGRRVAVRGPARLSACTLRVAGDFSAAAFFLAAAAATPGSRVTARGVSLNPTRTGLLDALEAMGAEVRRQQLRTEGGEPVGDVTVAGPERLKGVDLPPEWVPRLVDEVPAWAIAAAAAQGISRLRGAAELRLKESDRLAAIAENLAALGVTARSTADGLEIEGSRIGGGVVDARGDHRIAMAFATIGTLAREAVTVEDTVAIGTSYPGFVAALAALGADVTVSPLAPHAP